MKLWIIGKHGLLARALQDIATMRQIPFIATPKTRIDLLKPGDIRQFIKDYQPSHILNACGYTQVDLAEQHPDLARALNVDAVKNLIQCADENQCKCIHFSTDYVFSGQENIPYRENDLPSPINVYGHSKWAGEQQLWPYLDQALMIRTSWLFGHSQTNFVTKMQSMMREKETLYVVNDQYGRPTYARDLANATFDILEHVGIFHFANRGEASWYTFAQEIFKEMPKDQPLACKTIRPISSKEYLTAAKRPRFSVLHTEKIENLGVKIRPWREALQEMVHSL